MNPIDCVSLHPPRADSGIHQIIPRESGYHPVEINRCRIFPWYDITVTAREGHQTEHLIYKSYLLMILLF